MMIMMMMMIIIIFICLQIKIHDANKEQMIKPEPHLLLPLNRKRKKHRICIIHYN